MSESDEAWRWELILWTGRAGQGGCRLSAWREMIAAGCGCSTCLNLISPYPPSFCVHRFFSSAVHVTSSFLLYILSFSSHVRGGGEGQEGGHVKLVYVHEWCALRTRLGWGWSAEVTRKGLLSTLYMINYLSGEQRLPRLAEKSARSVILDHPTHPISERETNIQY
jgi:hypothetical protein